MAQKILFGAGGEAAFALSAIRASGDDVSYIIDNNEKRHGELWLGRKIIGFDDFLAMQEKSELIVSVELPHHRKEIISQITKAGIENWRVFHKSEWCDFDKERIVSYAQTTTLEDVILYHVCYEMENIFYIDVGAADPFYCSVTKTLYDMKNAHGMMSGSKVPCDEIACALCTEIRRNERARSHGYLCKGHNTASGM